MKPLLAKTLSDRWFTAGFGGDEIKRIAGDVLQNKAVPVSRVDPKPFLDAGISLAAIEYRFVQHKRLPAAHHDCRRAIQFLHFHTEKYSFDKTRIGAIGGSAGAPLCMYLGFHDDMADKDPSTDEHRAQHAGE